MRKILPLVLAVCVLPVLVAYAATHRGASKGAGGVRISVSPRSGRAFLPAPGAEPVPLALRLGNPGAARVSVTGLTVGVKQSPPGCPGAANLRIVQSNVSRRRPVRVPGRGSVTLPAQGVTAPTIQLFDRPINQDACKGARFPLLFTTSAHR